MARSKASRKYLLTINNPSTLGLTHERIKALLPDFASLIYWCMCDEVGEENGTPHTHLYLAFSNAVMFSTLHTRFYGAHIDMANGSHRENREYILKAGKWQDDAKHKTNLPETFEESGELPPERANVKADSEAILAMIKDGATNVEIMDKFPTAMNRLDKIEKARQTLLNEQHKNEFRTMEVHYIWGKTGSGKTRSVLEEYGYDNVCRVTNYDKHPFDCYKGEDIVMFEEFRSSLKIQDMLNYLDGYPIMLPCRYADKQACYTKVYIVTNIPFEEQYTDIQIEHPETWEAFKRRVNDVFEMLPPEDCDDIFESR